MVGRRVGGGGGGRSAPAARSAVRAHTARASLSGGVRGRGEERGVEATVGGTVGRTVGGAGHCLGRAARLRPRGHQRGARRLRFRAASARPVRRPGSERVGQSTPRCGLRQDWWTRVVVKNTLKMTERVAARSRGGGAPRRGRDETRSRGAGTARGADRGRGESSEVERTGRRDARGRERARPRGLAVRDLRAHAAQGSEAGPRGRVQVPPPPPTVLPTVPPTVASTPRDRVLKRARGEGRPGSSAPLARAWRRRQARGVARQGARESA